MAELHPNQIPFRAGRTAKANFVAEEDYLSRPLAQLGALAEDVAKKLSDDNDARLKDNVLLAQAKINDNIAKAKATQIDDYDRLIQESYDIYNQAFEGFSEPAINRFNRENPTYFEALQLSVNNQVFEKKKGQILQEALDDIPRLTSNAALGLYGSDGRGFVVEKLRQQLQDYLSVAEMDEVLNKVHSELDNYEISQLIAEHDWNGARAYLNDPMRHTTITPTEMVRYMERIAAGETADLKVKEEKKTKEEDPRAIYLKDAVASLARESTPYAPKDDEISLFLALARKGIVKQKDGSLMNVSDVSPSQWADWVSAAEKYAKDTGTKTASNGKILRDFDLAYDSLIGNEEDSKRNVRDMDIVKLTELENYLQNPIIYDSDNPKIQEQYNRAMDYIERADKIDNATSWAYATQLGADRINRYRAYSPYITKQDDTPGSLFARTYMAATDEDTYPQREDLQQMMSNTISEKIKTLENQGYKVPINSVAQYTVTLSSLLENLQAYAPEWFAKRYGMPNVTLDRQSQSYRRFMTGLIMKDLFSEELKQEDAERLTEEYLDMLRGYKLKNPTEDQKREPLALSYFLLNGRADGTYKINRYFDWPSANSFEDDETYRPINKYNKSIKR